MEAVLQSYYPWNDENNHTCLVFDGCNSSSSDFTFTLYLLNSLRTNKKIILICCNKSRLHYEYVLKKNGFDLLSLEKQGKLILKELLVDKYDTSTNGITWEDLKIWQDNNMPFGFSDYINSTQNNNKTDLMQYQLMIDDLDIFQMISPTIQSGIRFISRSLKLIHSTKIDCKSIICYGRSNNNDNKDSNTTINTSDHGFSLVEYLRYRASCLVEILPLSTGYSMDIHGLIRITYRQDSSFSSSSSLTSSRNNSTSLLSKQNMIKLGTMYNSNTHMSSTSKSINETVSTTESPLVLIQRTLIYKAMDSGVKCSEVLIR